MTKACATSILERAREMPTNPGVYLLKDASGTIIYVGKAANLRNRVRSYFSDSGLSPKTQQLVNRIRDIDFYITGSEEEALVLELNLIKRHHPYYNVRLKDDKSFPYLKIDLSEDWPRVLITRRLASDGGRYFGPFASAKSIRQALNVVKVIFPFRSCNRRLDGRPQRSCLEYDMHHCAAPCIGAVTRDEYAEIMQGLILFLEGKQEILERRLESQMKNAALSQQFERAALIRDQLKAIREVIAWQKMSTRVRGDQDVIAFAQDKDQAYVQVFFVRGGKLIGRDGYVLQGTGSEGPSQIMDSFVQQYYAATSNIPPLILLQHPLEDKAVIQRWLAGRRGGAVRLQVPLKGPRKELLNTVAENAIKGLEQLRIKNLAEPAVLESALAELKTKLGLPNPPTRIEGYDISNIQGRMAVGSMVVFQEGKPKPAHYRRFRIQTVPQADDYAMLKEVMQRRFRHLKDGKAADAWMVLPDLVLIDGGKGQLGSVREAMKDAGAEAISVVGLAKKNEEIFVPGRARPVSLPASSPGLQLLQRVRDEAHRFALGYHHHLGKKEVFTSALDEIPGIGPKRKRALLRQFGSFENIKQASLEDLTAAPGITHNLARKIKEHTA